MADQTLLPALDAARHDIARDATYEIQVLAQKLRSELNSSLTDCEISALARGLLTRISDLSDILFEAVVQDEEQRESTPDLRSRLGFVAH